MCSPARLAVDQERIERVLRAAHTVLFTTFTLADEQRSASLWSLTPILETWGSAFSTGSWMGDFRTRCRVSGWVRSLEVTFHPERVHPHAHAAFVLDAEPGVAEVERLTEHWIESAARRGYRAARSAQKAEFVKAGDDRARVAFYLCEQNAIRQSRGGKGRTPGDLLHSAAMTGDADDLARLLQFHNAVSGKRKISVNRPGFSGGRVLQPAVAGRK